MDTMPQRPRRPYARSLMPGDLLQLVPGVVVVVCNVENPPKAPRLTVRVVGRTAALRYSRTERVAVIGRTAIPRCQHI
ncbi:hypothetical protein ACQEVS_10210 [Streptomyces sp. CA-181903]|uniref:hypothetical protein n=1 Tax=Streptomyces sp. CA-181903 TaxID=3240055 RepID=UPI003D8BBA3E